MKKLLLAACFCAGLTLLSLVDAHSESVPPASEDIFVGHNLIGNWQISEADAYVQGLQKTHPNSGDVYFLQARVEFFKGNYEYAEKLLGRIGNNQRRVKEFKSPVGLFQYFFGVGNQDLVGTFDKTKNKMLGFPGNKPGGGLPLQAWSTSQPRVVRSADWEPPLVPILRQLPMMTPS